MDRNEFKKRVEDSGCTGLDLRLYESSEASKILSPKNFAFFESTKNFLITEFSASLGKHAAIGGDVDIPGDNTQYIGHALDEKIVFLGKFLVWASSFGYPVTGFEIDILPVTQDEKNSYPSANSIPMADVATGTTARYFLESYESARDLIDKKFPMAWFKRPELFRFAYILRNALAHNGKWGIDDKRSPEHLQTEIFTWPRAGLTIQMRDAAGKPVDEGGDVSQALGGADFVVLLIEMNDELKAQTNKYKTQTASKYQVSSSDHEQSKIQNF